MKFPFNLLAGFLFVVIIWLFTLNGYWSFGIATLIIIPVFFIMYSYLASHFKLFPTIAIVIITFILWEIIMNYIEKRYPDLSLLDDEHFPTSNLYQIGSVIWVTIHLCLDSLLGIIKPQLKHNSKIDMLVNKIRTK